MAMKACKECNTQVSTKADKCPNCGAPAKSGVSGIVKVLGGVVAALVLFAMCAAAVSGDKDKPVSAPSATTETTADAAADEAPAVEVESVQLTDLLDTYKNNELKGDNTYKGKRIEVTGKVSDVKKSITGSPYVTLGTGKQFEIPEVQCSLHESSAAAASDLEKGQEITVHGTVTGLMMNVQLNDCTLP